MFSQEYQSGDAGVEVFSAAGKSPGKKWKVSSSVHRVYDKTVKGFVFLLDKKSSSSGAMMQLPPVPSKETLGLTQGFLVLQLRLLAKRALTVEINILSLRDKRQRYRLHLSNKFRNIEVHQMHAQIPLGPLLTPDTWTHFVLDVASLTSFFFKNHDFGSIDSITLHSGCRLRKIFTLPSVKKLGAEGGDPSFFHCPHNFDFPIGTSFEDKVVDMTLYDGQRSVAPVSGSQEGEGVKNRDGANRNPLSKPSSKVTHREAFDITPNVSCDPEKDAESSRRNSGQPDTKKKQLLALNSRRARCKLDSSTAPGLGPSSSPLPSDFFSPLKSPSPAPVSAPTTRQPPPLMTMMSMENALPAPTSPVTCQAVVKTETTREVITPGGCHGPPPSHVVTISAQVVADETETAPSMVSGSIWREPEISADGSGTELLRTSTMSPPFSHMSLAMSSPTNSASQSFENTEHWVVTETSHNDSPLKNGTIFSFVDAAAQNVPPYLSPREDDLHSSHSSTATSSHDAEEDKEGGQSTHSHGRISRASPEKCLSPRDSTHLASNTAHGNECNLEDGSSGGDDKRNFEKLKEHFYQLKGEFVEEYGEAEVTRLLQLYMH